MTRVNNSIGAISSSWNAPSKMKTKARAPAAATASSPTRIKFPQPLVLALCAQVDQVCALCDMPLFSVKRGRRFREFQVAHIYPLNPTPDEVTLLEGEKRLSLDSNHDKNLIPLCLPCHSDFDEPKTIQGYRRLYEIKARLIAEDERRETIHAFTIEREIVNVLVSLSSHDAQFKDNLAYNTKTIDSKLNDTIAPLTRARIKSDVTMFYPFIQDRFAEMERVSTNKATLIATQVKAFYLKRADGENSQQQIFQDTVDWIFKKTGSLSRPAAEAVAAFFIQNCEVF